MKTSRENCVSHPAFPPAGEDEEIEAIEESRNGETSYPDDSVTIPFPQVELPADPIGQESGGEGEKAEPEENEIGEEAEEAETEYYTIYSEPFSLEPWVILLEEDEGAEEE